jgi:hypothetical protein
MIPAADCPDFARRIRGLCENRRPIFLPWEHNQTLHKKSAHVREDRRRRLQPVAGAARRHFVAKMPLRGTCAKGPAVELQYHPVGPRGPP